ncbi:unnamed protein product [Diatraea saccharalis]|uniref:Uncharacterized protein n=1 Tax=Diatraea saccharalis TaxID=40085 RepID=A0A9N9R803_9NEOP|nr:unnamed protein product [Diatraea saccharalis]
MMELTTAKAISMLTLGLGSFIAGMIPACISEGTRQRHPLFISCLLCFGGGVLFSTSITHMLPEARINLPNYAEVTFCVGFFLVYLVDEIVHLFYGPGNDPHRQTYGSNEGTSLLGHERSGRLDNEMVEHCCGDTGNPRMCHVSHTAPCNKSSSGVIGMLCALFVHSVLEGLAIGLQENTSQVLLLLAAVASHKFVVGFCLGAELCASAPGRVCAHIVCVVLFSGGSVVGIGIGTGLEAVNSVKDSFAIPIMQVSNKQVK